ncbi:unnamed protein product [Amoebophrya sp. A25]|nr:unnamed protein product [Amoebophrya sp. A25]|eukprot:GSA25T00026991001.1
MGAGKLAPDTNEFAHFTTFPMAIAPHFGRVLMRSVFLMWRQRKRLQDAQRKQDHQTLQLLEGAASNGGDDGHEIFQVVEMGAGSGQLGKDIRDCVVENCLGLSPELNKAWQSAFRYTILERSPALATRQRERGLEVIVSDAQTVKACDVLKSKAARSDFHADVVISNELIDAFAPVKLKLSVFDLDNVDPGKCSSWTEMKLLHLIKIQDVMGLFAQQLGISEPSRIVRDLQSFTDTFFCTAMETSVGQAAKEVVPRNTTCMTTVLALSALMETSNLQIPAASNNVRLRLRKDVVVQSNLRKLVRDLQKELDGFLAIPRNIYQELRRGLKERTRAQENLDVTFLIATKTKRLSVPISPDRCRSAGIGTFLGRHRERNKRLAKFYHDLGYPYVVMRPGEEEFLKLTDCVIGDKGGHVLTIDYGASYEPLANSLSVDPGYDGIFVPPIPHHLMEELPHCHGDWTVCAGRIDWTTFVDFTNMAAAGLELGYETVWYGPQCFLEQMGNQMVALDRATDESRLLANPQPRSEITPGYSTIENVDWVNRHAVNWYGPEKAEPWQQRWTGFKALLQRVPARDAETKKRSKEPSSGPASEALSLAAAARTPHAASVAVSKRRLSDPVEAAVQKHQKSLTIGAQIAGTKTIVGAKKAFAAAANNTNTSSAASTTESLTASQVSTTSSPTAAADAKAPGGKSPSTLNEVDPSTYFDVVPFPTWHLDSTEKDPCWLFDPTNMPIADWSRINRHETNATTRQVLSTLSVDVDRNLGERYAMGYEDAQLAVRLVDFLVKSQGCLAMAQPTSISLKWKPWMRQRWADVWRADTLDRVGPAVMSMLRLEASGAPRGRHYPFECMAAQTFRIMCADVLVPQEA